MNKKTILIVFLGSTVFYISSTIAPLWASWASVIYKITYYGSIPWSLPWFEPPFQACLECDASQAILIFVHYVGFIINVFLVFMLIRFFIRSAPNPSFKRDDQGRPLI